VQRARELAAKLVPMARDQFGKTAQFSEFLQSMGVEFIQVNDLETAEQLFAESLQLQRSLADADEVSLAVSIHCMGALRRLQGRFHDAEQFFRDELALGLSISSFETRQITYRALYEMIDEQHREDDAWRARMAAGDEMILLARYRHPIGSATWNNAISASFTVLEAYHEGDRAVLASAKGAQARALRDAKSYNAAKMLYEEALALCPEPASPIRAAIWNGLGVLYHSTNNWEEARAAFSEALQLATQPVDRMPILLNQIPVLQRFRDVESAAKLVNEALTQPRGGLPADTRAQALRILARYQVEERHLPEAIALFDELIGLLESSAYRDEDLRCESLIGLGLSHRMAGRYADAVSAFTKALELSETLGDEGKLAEALDGVGLTYTRLGQFVVADKALQEALAINERIADDLSLAITLNNLATLREEMHSLAEAHEYYQRAQKILDTLDATSDRAVSCMSNTALLLRKMGDYRMSEKLSVKVIAIGRQTGRDKRPTFAVALGNLAMLYEEVAIEAGQQGVPGEEYCGKAEALLREAIAVSGGEKAKPTVVLAQTFGAMGMVARLRGRYKESLEWFEKGFTVTRAAGAENSALLYRTRVDMATALAASGKPEQALELFREVADNEKALITGVLSLSSERGQLDYMDRWRGETHAAVSLVLGHLQNSRRACAVLFVMVLERKGIVADSLTYQRRVERTQDSPLQGLLEQLSMVLPSDDGSMQMRDEADARERLREDLERSIRRELTHAGIEVPQVEVDLKRLAQAVPRDGALIEFYAFSRYDLAAVPARGDARRKERRYVAFVMRHQLESDVRLIDVGPADPIDALVEQWRAAVGTDPEDNAHAARQVDVIGEKLKRAVLDPILSALEGCQRLIISPDGLLNLIPFETLRSGEDRWVIDDFDVNYVSSGRDLLRSTGKPLTPGEPIVAADPDYDCCSTAKRDKTDTVFFEPLPNTRLEGREVAAKLGVSPLIGKQVVKSRLMAAKSPAVLHIATHGFFDDDARELTAQLEFQALRSSGLALAGANCAGRGLAPPKGEDAGILTAEAASLLDLEGTELVVLSACQTGVGAIHSGQGVYGLRRAFALAGARSLVMSLWEVPDETTRELMDYFYTALLQGAGRSEALRAARRALRDSYHHAYYWGAFICQGDSGPLAYHRKNSKRASAA